MMPKQSYISEIEQVARIEGNILLCKYTILSRFDSCGRKRIAQYYFPALRKQTVF